MDEHIRKDTYINVLENNTCNICYNEFSNDKIIVTNCSHIYCEDCLLTWFRRSKTSCPICVQDVSYYIKNNEKNHIVRITEETNNEGNNGGNNEGNNGGNNEGNNGGNNGGNNNGRNNNGRNNNGRTNILRGNVYVSMPRWKFNLLRYSLLFNMSYILYYKYVINNNIGLNNYRNCSG